MAEAGIGVDIVEIARMERILQRTPAFARRVFTDEERAYCESSPRPAAHYACRFAAREAVLKALGTGFSHGIGKADVSVSRDPSGRPLAVLSGRAADIAQQMGVVEVALSLSFTADLAIANAMAITNKARPKPKETKEDERAVIARSFREARAVLDDLERVQDDALAALSGPASSGSPKASADADKKASAASSVSEDAPAAQGQGPEDLVAQPASEPSRTSSDAHSTQDSGASQAPSPGSEPAGRLPLEQGV